MLDVCGFHIATWLIDGANDEREKRADEFKFKPSFFKMASIAQTSDSGIPLTFLYW
jgi:hypothetical protein